MRRFRDPLARALALTVVAGMLCGCLSTAVGAGATAAIAASEERGIKGAAIDTRIRADVNSAWADASLEIWQKLGLDVVERRVLLTGKVPTEAERARAVQLVWKVDGVKEVIDEIKVTDKGDVGNYARDTWISTQLRTKLLLDKDVLSINYSIETVDQAVYLIGIAQDEAERSRVINYARSLPYVQKVVNYVWLKDDPRRSKA
jgi:osmotically-inducible protein OsmY